ncbi:MAG TPA: hypothetical protein PLT49_08220, partial [Ferruginibacter sp.]|nr:hypothetical protein [Ferruginibacter sp.]
MISIVPYEDRYQPDFERLNMEWLELYSLTEEYDLAILNDPRDTVINKGGAIFLVLEDDSVIGTAGIARVSDTQYELIKMAV